MIASEDRNIPQTKVTQRYNPYSKSWVKKDREFKEDEQQNPLAGGQVQTEETITQSELSSLEQADRMLDQREKLRQNAMNYGMPSENPQAKIPASPGQSGSSGVYRTRTGPITLDDMERILGSVYQEKQACGCSHPCSDPCSCITQAQKNRIIKSGADSPVTKEEFQRAQKFSQDLKESRRQWEAENDGKFVDKEFGL